MLKFWKIENFQHFSADRRPDLPQGRGAGSEDRGQHRGGIENPKEFYRFQGRQSALFAKI